MHSIRGVRSFRSSVALSIVLAGLSASMAHGQSSDAIAAAIAKPGRLPADLQRDTRSRPDAILPLLMLEPGDRAVDIFGSGGYYSELMASVVGDEGEVLLHNNRGFRAWGINLLNDRFTNRSVPNVTQHDRELADLDLGKEAIDAVLIVMAFHDLYVVPTRYDGERYVPVGKPADVDHFLRQVHAALKPGARLVVIDHSASSETSRADASELHRMHEDFARAEIESRGFEFVAASDALRNPSDDRQSIVFDTHIKGKTDRFVLVFEKPYQRNSASTRPH
jgi:predicted methyltransferase